MCGRRRLMSGLYCGRVLCEQTSGLMIAAGQLRPRSRALRKCYNMLRAGITELIRLSGGGLSSTSTSFYMSRALAPAWRQMKRAPSRLLPLTSPPLPLGRQRVPGRALDALPSLETLIHGHRDTVGGDLLGEDSNGSAFTFPSSHRAPAPIRGTRPSRQLTA